MKTATQVIPAHVSRHLTDHASSGLDLKAYCDKHSISYGALRYWFKRWKIHTGRDQMALPIKEVGVFTFSRSVCDVHFPSGIRISINSGARKEDLSPVFALLANEQTAC